MSEFFRLFVAEILSSSAFRDRHPHFHRRWVPLEDLEHVTLPELTASELAEQAKYERAIAAGDPQPADSFWTARQADRVIVDPRRLLTEDGETFIAEDGHALILESGTS
jgi:hypothetical protein